MTDKAEALEEIITLLAVPPISSLHRQAAAMLTAQAAEIAALKALVSKFEKYHVHYHKQGFELADNLERLMGETWIVNHELYDILAHLRGDTP
jgi:hypothetical protein